MDRKLIRARDVMRAQHLQMEGMATVREALMAMREQGEELVIVRKRNQHDAYGIVLLADIAKQVLARDRAPERVNIYEIMSKPVVPLDPEMDVRYCARLFERFGLANAPVIENGEIAGIVSYRELVLQGLCELPA